MAEGRGEVSPNPNGRAQRVGTADRTGPPACVRRCISTAPASIVIVFVTPLAAGAGV